MVPAVFADHNILIYQPLGGLFGRRPGHQNFLPTIRRWFDAVFGARCCVKSHKAEAHVGRILGENRTGRITHIDGVFVQFPAFNRYTEKQSR